MTQSSLMPEADVIEAARRSALGVTVHGPEDFAGMRKAGRLAAEVLDLMVPEVNPGVTTEALDKLAFEYVMDHGAIPACVGYRGYRHTLCTSLNHVVCHGIPGTRALKEGDIINIDVTVIVDGWHGDTSRMYYAGEVKRKAQRLVETTYDSMMRGNCRGEARRHHRRYRPRHPVLRRRRTALRGRARFLRPWSRPRLPRPAQHRALWARRSGHWRSSPACSLPWSR